MRLLNINTLRLQEFHPGQEPDYATLSHTWGWREITYEEITANGNRLPNNRAALKIRNFCKAVQFSVEYDHHKPVSWAWIDTCCINKSSSAELQEAINSMFNWYKSAQAYYVHLQDVQVGDFDDLNADEDEKKVHYEHLRLQVKRTRWFKRGWTLQELIASKIINFYDRDWREVGNFAFLSDILVEVIGIPVSMCGLEGIDIEEFEETDLQERMNWARNRRTTRPEDRAYSMLGILDVSMPMIYGEGRVKALKRLAREVEAEHEVQLNFEALN